MVEPLYLEFHVQANHQRIKSYIHMLLDILETNMVPLYTVIVLAMA